ncbi:MAG: type II toxin-antitoxin system RelE/ParE family toxin [Deltaproteobacteria bacterium]|nr:type II toxin-antitoxin system RelE/ParE family toxin [Deltaproteobacteria bacterium]
MVPPKRVVARFYRQARGHEPVRDWLGALSREDRRSIGRDLMAVEFGWPCGPPLCRSLVSYPGLYEVRSNLTGGRIARVFFTISGSTMLLLHGFIKKTQSTPLRELRLAERRMKEYQHGR